MDIENMSDWEIYGVLQKRGEERKQAERVRRERVSNMIYDIMKSNEQWNDILMAEARASLRPAEYERLSAEPHTLLKRMNIHVSFAMGGAYE